MGIHHQIGCAHQILTPTNRELLRPVKLIHIHGLFVFEKITKRNWVLALVSRGTQLILANQVGLQVREYYVEEDFRLRRELFSVLVDFEKVHFNLVVELFVGGP